MKICLILLFSAVMIGVIVACNKTSKEENDGSIVKVGKWQPRKPQETVQRPKGENSNFMKGIENSNEIYYSIDSCGNIYKAVVKNNIEEIKQLLANGADEGDKFCSLSWTIEQGHHREPSLVNMKIVKLLLDAKTNVNARQVLPTDYNDNTLLEKATNTSSAELVQLLIEAGANMESKNRALNIAIENNYIEIVKLLLAAGVEDNAKNNALSFAIRSKHFEIAEMLLSDGAKTKGDLASASAGGSSEIVKALLKTDVDKNEKRQALINAIENTHVDIVKLLLAAGTDINGYKKNDEKSSSGIKISDIWEDSPLDIAIRKEKYIQEDKKSLQEMINMESDPNCLGCGPDEEELARLERLQKSEQNISEIIKLLKAAGAKE